MTPNLRFIGLPKHFWANIRLISQHVGYTQRLSRQRAKDRTKRPGKRASGPIKIPNLAEITAALEELELRSDHILAAPGKPTEFGAQILGYLEYRADALNQFVKPRLMDKQKAGKLFEKLRRKLRPKCPLPMNKQKKAKKANAYFTGIINMLIESNCQGMACDYDPGELTTITHDGVPYRTLARRVDGAFPRTADPIAIWEIKEYYYTTTFGSRVADGVYESLLDGMELEEARREEPHIQHYLMIDDYFTWWECGRSYLCRIIDMLHMGYVDEVLFGHEVFDRLPRIVKDWVKTARNRGS